MTINPKTEGIESGQKEKDQKEQSSTTSTSTTTTAIDNAKPNKLNGDRVGDRKSWYKTGENYWDN